MLEHIHRFQRTGAQLIEEVVEGFDTSGLRISHSVLPPGEATPRRQTEADVNLLCLSGTLALRLADQRIHTYEAGTILTVPAGISMEIRSAGTEVLEYFAIAGPNPTSLPIGGREPCIRA